MAMLLAALVCAAVDVSLTRIDHAHRAAEWLLPLEAIAGYVVWGLLTWPAARLIASWTGSRFVAHLVVMATPVALHSVLRDALRNTALLSEPRTLIDVGLVLGTALGALVLCHLVTRRSAQPESLDDTRSNSGAVRVLGATLGLGAVVAMAPGVFFEGDATASAAENTAEGERPPNLLLLVWDTTRAQNLTPYGYDRDTTPQLAKLAEGGALFENAFSTTVFTLSSHTSMLTGVAPTTHGTTMTNQWLDHPTIVPLLQRAGYRTGAFVGTKVLRASTNFLEGFDVYDDLVDPPLCDTRLWGMVHDVQAAAAQTFPALNNNGNPHWFETLQRPADDVLANALNFIEDAEATDQPWFVFINMFDVHWPYLPVNDAQALFVADYGGPMDGFTFRSDDYPDGYQPKAADKSHIVDLYDAEMFDLDRTVDAFLSKLDLGNGETTVLMTSDHGEGFGEDRHGEQLWSHEHLHGPQTRVPFLLYAPGDIEAGQTVDAPVSGVDIAPTLLDFAGLSDTFTWPMLGESLRDLTVTEGRKVYLVDHDNLEPGYDSAAVILGDYKLFDLEGERTLHDIHADRLDITDVSAEHEELRGILDKALDEFLDGSVTGGEMTNVDTDVLRALGYMDGKAPPPKKDDEESESDDDGK